MNNPTIDKYGNKIWYNEKGQPHREDEPAIEWANEAKYWCINGLLHRLDGPAMEWDDNKRWYYYGKKINCSTQEEFERLIKLRIFW